MKNQTNWQNALLALSTDFKTSAKHLNLWSFSLSSLLSGDLNLFAQDFALCRLPKRKSDLEPGRERTFDTKCFRETKICLFYRNVYPELILNSSSSNYSLILNLVFLVCFSPPLNGRCIRSVCQASCLPPRENPGKAGLTLTAGTASSDSPLPQRLEGPAGPQLPSGVSLMIKFIAPGRRGLVRVQLPGLCGE